MLNQGLLLLDGNGIARGREHLAGNLKVRKSNLSQESTRA